MVDEDLKSNDIVRQYICDECGEKFIAGHDYYYDKCKVCQLEG